MQHASVPPEAFAKADQHASLVHLVNGKTGDGEDFFAYISVLPSRYEDFILISRAKEEMNLHEFGDVIECGFGMEPPEDVRRAMESRHDIDFTFHEKLVEVVAEAKKIQNKA